MSNESAIGKPMIHIVDDEIGMRDSLRLLFRSMGFEVATYAQPAEFLEHAAPAANACLITDLRMPLLNGIELLQAIRARGMRMPVVMISAHGSIRHAVDALRHGAVDFIEKPFDEQDIIDAVHNALRRPYEDDAATADRCQALIGRLTRREREVLARVVSGKPNKLIARELALSARTVEAHRANLMHKLNVASVAELVGLAVRCRLVDDAELGNHRNETG